MLQIYKNRRKKYKLGDRQGSLVLIKELGYKNGKILGRFKCDCGNMKDIRINDVLSNKKYTTKTCGCKTYRKKHKHKKKYKQTKDEYSEIKLCLECKKRECDNCLSRKAYG